MPNRLLDRIETALRGWLSWRALAGVNILFFIVTGALLLRIDAIGGLARIPTPIATLLAAILGFSGIAWQSRKGFRNLIASQEHRAKIEREAREEQHQRELEAEQRRRDGAAKALAAARTGELVAFLDFAHNNTNTFQTYAEMNRVMAKEGLKEIALPRFNGFHARIYEANIGKLDLLNASLVGDLAKVFARTAAMPATSGEKIRIDTAIAVLMTASKVWSTTADDILHVALRMRAFEWGQEDPGTLVERDQRKTADTTGKAGP
jgi:hypothetical protein